MSLSASCLMGSTGRSCCSSFKRAWNFRGGGVVCRHRAYAPEPGSLCRREASVPGPMKLILFRHLGCTELPVTCATPPGSATAPASPSLPSGRTRAQGSQARIPHPVDTEARLPKERDPAGKGRPLGERGGPGQGRADSMEGPSGGSWPGQHPAGQGLHLPSGSFHVNTPELGTRHRQPRGVGTVSASSLHQASEATPTFSPQMKSSTPRVQMRPMPSHYLPFQPELTLSPFPLEGSNRGRWKRIYTFRTWPGCHVELGFGGQGGRGEASGRLCL